MQHAFVGAWLHAGAESSHMGCHVQPQTGLILLAEHSCEEGHLQDTGTSLHNVVQVLHCEVHRQLLKLLQHSVDVCVVVTVRQPLQLLLLLLLNSCMRWTCVCALAC